MEKQSRTNKLKLLGAGYAATASWATTVACAVAMLALTIMTVIVTGDVILRYVFHAPTKWSVEVSGYLLVVIVMMGLAYTQRERGHIKVDIILRRLPKAVRSWVELVVLVMVFAITIILIYLTAGDFWVSIELKSVSDSVMAFPLAPWQAFIPIGLVILALLLIWEIYTETVKIRRREYESEEAPKLPQEGA
jgi:TRAP-type C4-dicarboxylate transport system permease small subunit